jgi:hypothetical protein
LGRGTIPAHHLRQEVRLLAIARSGAGRGPQIRRLVLAFHGLLPRVTGFRRAAPALLVAMLPPDLGEGFAEGFAALGARFAPRTGRAADLT